ncbi:MAG: hypothetical protein RLZZ59_563 [Pseudomonadota bacterium]
MTIEELKSRYKYDLATPMMQQYLDIKFENYDSLILFRMGDFYELFFEDAITASKVLGLALAKRGKHAEEDLAMCGVPHHALETYLRKLVEENYKVAIVEQLETPEEAKQRGYKAVVKREVVRIITPGTVTEDSIVTVTAPNYLVSIRLGAKSTIAYLDINTAEFKVVTVKAEDLTSEVAKLNPKEIIISEKDASASQLQNWRNLMVVQVESYFASTKCQKIIENFYNIKSYTSIGIINEQKISAIGGVLEYLNITQKKNVPLLALPHIVETSKYMCIDASTRSNLELVHTLSGSYKGSLLSVINHTVTTGGSRLLYQFLTSPLTDLEEISLRHKKVELFFNNMHLTKKLRVIMKEISDIERIITKISMKRCIPQDLLNLRYSIEAAAYIQGEVVDALGAQYPQEISDILSDIAGHDKINYKIRDIIREDAPNNIADGGFVKPSYHPKLLELYSLLDNTNDILETLKIEYQNKTGIDNLKIGHNNIWGLFIEVTPKNANKMTDPEFIHKQTMVSAVRYTTEKLKKVESDMLNAKSLIIGLEQKIFLELCDNIIEYAGDLYALAMNISNLDVFTNLAYVAETYNYVKPDMLELSEFTVNSGRHPVVESVLKNGRFISNDCSLREDSRLWLMTGPNMSGKSTFLRQNALIILLAQMGSFVPAASARIGVVDKLFSRIGASDDLAKGQSTFMVEMIETATILAQATSKSFIILDEVGRGTATYDGVSIAWACLEYIHDKLKCRSLFATHYHELTSLSDSLAALKNYTIKVQEENGVILFLHNIMPGSADKSYGIHVAELAGLPRAVTDRAYQILSKLEKESDSKKKHVESIVSHSASLFDYAASYSHVTNSIEEALNDINPDALSPRDALDEIYRLKGMITKTK